MLTLNTTSNRVKLVMILVVILMLTLNINKVSYITGYKNTREIKRILFWNSFFSDETYDFGLGYKPFLEHKCKVKDCVITNDKNYLPQDQFDAVIFHGPEFAPVNISDFPSRRSSHQRYVYFSMESPRNRPVSPNLDNVFNWTMTYRLDSDILVPYFTFTDTQGNIVSPSDNPKWIKKTISSSKTKQILVTKKKPVAWFASNCYSNNQREQLVADLQNNLSVDIYGACGPLKCPRNDESVCFKMLKSDYYFYLSFENSNCEDYMTEKLTNAMLNDAVPIVLGGANFNKFLPPDSYIDATKLTTQQLARKIEWLIQNPDDYLAYFWWKDFYRLTTRENSQYKPFCKLCEMLHDANLAVKQYKELRTWWNGDDNHKICTN